MGPPYARRVRRPLKRVLPLLEPGRRDAQGATLLIYHRVGGGSSDELDVDPAELAKQLDVLSQHDVVPLDAALDRLDDGDPSPSVVLTFDDGFEDVYQHAWPLLRDRRLPFTVYLASAYAGASMRWDGSTATGTGRGLTWDQLREMTESGLCTLGNHTATHCVPHLMSEQELDTCSDTVELQLGMRPRHFAWTWGVPVPSVLPAVRERFRSAATGGLGRNTPDVDRHALTRVPVRRTDPISFFAAKIRGDLRPERAYAAIVATAKRVGVRA